ncbi:MAG: hypothetical protein IKB23_02680, partial [Clostridia bacterium]|nr:hypothetical protein [Clostridia bacterium]
MFTKTKILIISLISAVALLVAVAASAVIITYVSPNSDKTFKNTSDRLFSDFSELGEIEELLDRTDNAQSLYLFILGDDLGLSSNIQIKSEGIFLNSDKNEGSVSFTLTVGEINLPISVYYNDEKITVQGLNEDNITIPKANIKEELEQSVLAPDSDSQFALDRETFDELVERIDSLINKGDTSEEEEKREKELADLEKAIKNITAHVKNHIDTKSGLSFSKTGFRLVKNNELHFDKDAIAEIFVAIAEESEKNETLRGYLNSVFFTESDGDTDNSGGTASIIPLSADTSGTAKGKDALLELAESIKEKFEALDITLAYTTRGNYLEKLDVTVATRTDGDNESAVTLSTDFTVTGKNAELVATLRSEAKTDGKTEESEITANYSKVKTANGFDINLDLTVCDEPDEKECEDETFTFNFSYNEKNGKFNTALESKKFNFELSGVYKFDKENKDLSIKVDKVHRFGEESFTERLLTFTVTKTEATEISVPDGKSLVTMSEHEIFDAFRSLPIYKVEGMVYELIGTSFGFVYTNDYKLIFHPDVTTSLASVCLEKYKEYVKAPETDLKDSEIRNTYVYDSVNDVYLLFDYETRNSVKVVSKCPTSGSYHSAYIDEYGNYAVHDIIVEKDTPNTCGSRGYKRGVCKECGKEVVKHKPVIPHEMTSKTYNTTDVSGTQITVTLTYC